MENYPFVKKTLNTRGQNVDRFVYNREHLTKVRHSWRPQIVPEHKDILDTKLWIRRNYIRQMDKAFGFEEKRNKCVVKPWPCNPRRKSYLTSADSVLDLPTFSNDDFPELLDWGRNGILVAALGTCYYKWSWDSQSIAGRGVTYYDIQTCKFDPKGDLIAIGMVDSSIQIHDNAKSKALVHKKCICYIKAGCSITSLDWSPTGNALIVGCSRSKVTSYSKNLQVIALLNQPWHFIDPIYCVRISPNARFAAITTMRSPNVIVVTWPFLQPHRIFHIGGSFTRAMVWHPWRSALLACGGVTHAKEAKISLFSVPNSKIEENTLPGTYCLDSMLFSHKSGELILSLYNAERGLRYPKTSSSIAVLSDLSTVVDQWSDDGRTGLNRVRTMVCSPDGTKLATATIDEDLIIWNFLPETKNKKLPEYNLAAMAVYLDKEHYSMYPAGNCCSCKMT